jgi:hypothetical protein
VRAKKIKYLCFVLFVGILIPACKKDVGSNPELDFRDKLVGVYYGSTEQSYYSAGITHDTILVNQKITVVKNGDYPSESLIVEDVVFDNLSNDLNASKQDENYRFTEVKFSGDNITFERTNYSPGYTDKIIFRGTK